MTLAGAVRGGALGVAVLALAACAPGRTGSVAPSKAGGERRASTATADEERARGAEPRDCPAASIDAVVTRVNAARRAAGVALLTADPRLGRVARARASAMAHARRLSHSGWETTLRNAGARGPTLGENVAFGYASAEAVMDGWLRSPGHRANILSPTFQAIGVGCVVDGEGERWWTQDFEG